MSDPKDSKSNGSERDPRDPGGSGGNSGGGGDGKSPQGPRNPNVMSRGMVSWLLFGGLMIAILLMFSSQQNRPKEITWTECMSLVDQGAFEGKLVIEPSRVIGTLKEGIEMYPFKDDDLGMSLRYLLVDALEKQAVKNKSVEMAREAQKMASEILQVSIRYRDIRDRIENLKKVVAGLMDDAA